MVVASAWTTLSPIGLMLPPLVNTWVIVAVVAETPTPAARIGMTTIGNTVTAATGSLIQGATKETIRIVTAMEGTTAIGEIAEALLLLEEAGDATLRITEDAEATLGALHVAVAPLVATGGIMMPRLLPLLLQTGVSHVGEDRIVLLLAGLGTGIPCGAFSQIIQGLKRWVLQ